MEIKPTTTLRKISSLRKRIWCLRGSQGAGKTFSVLQVLINHASSCPNREIIILSHELSKMRLTVIKDFVNVMQAFGLFDARRWIGGTLYRFPNGSFIKFIGLDKEDVGKGLRSHVAFFNEANKINGETYRQVASRADRVIVDYNPDVEFWVDTDVIPREDCDFLQLTFQDNEALGSAERNEILEYRNKAYHIVNLPEGRNEGQIDFEGNIKSEYWWNIWQVYGLGNIGKVDGLVFQNWNQCDSIPSNARLLGYGIDFGFSISKFACVAMYKMDGAYYLKEVVYSNSLTNQMASKSMRENGYVEGTICYCDYAEPKSIAELRKEGIRAIECESKNDIKTFAIKLLNNETFYVEKNSLNLMNELRQWKYDEKTGKPKKNDVDHLMDALCYFVGSDGKYDGSY